MEDITTGHWRDDITSHAGTEVAATVGRGLGGVDKLRGVGLPGVAGAVGKLDDPCADHVVPCVQEQGSGNTSAHGGINPVLAFFQVGVAVVVGVGIRCTIS